VTLNNIVKLKSAADYNVKLRSEELKKKKLAKSKSKPTLKKQSKLAMSSQGIFSPNLLV
jgi:hypothetical protein